MDPTYHRPAAGGRYGFPAHAGMDPASLRRGRLTAWGFPAHAGMDPLRTAAARLRPMVSPPTRGWTAVIPDEPGA